MIALSIIVQSGREHAGGNNCRDGGGWHRDHSRRRSKRVYGGLPTDAQAVLIVELDGIEAGIDEDAAQAESIL